MTNEKMEKWDVTRTSPLTNKTITMTFCVYPSDVERYMNGTFIQVAFPYLSDDDREFILTGYTKEDWDKMFPDE